MLRPTPTALAVCALFLVCPALQAGPVSGTVVAGQAGIRSNGSQTDIVQTTARAVIDWSRFDIGSGESVHFRQPDARSVTLNRVTGGDPSQILGTLTATGQVILLNPNGVLFGRQARVDAAGLVVTTARLGTEDFMAGRLNFTASDRSGGTVENQGTITVREGGLAAFVAPHVRNDGVIRADLGRVMLASGSSFVVDLAGDGLLSLAVRESDLKGLVDAQGRAVTALVENTGSLVAPSGQVVVMTPAFAGQLVDKAIHLGGVVRADTIQRDRAGAIVLSAANGDVQLTGEIAAPGGSFRLQRDLPLLSIQAETAESLGGILRSGTHVAVTSMGRVDVDARIDGRGGVAGAGLALDAAALTIRRDIATNDGAISVQARTGALTMARPGGEIEPGRRWPLLFAGAGDITLAAVGSVVASHLITTGAVSIESAAGNVGVVSKLGADLGGAYPLKSLTIRANGRPDSALVGNVSELYDVTVAAGGTIDIEASRNVQIFSSSNDRAGLLAARQGLAGRSLRLQSGRLGDGDLAANAWYWTGTNSRLHHAGPGTNVARADQRWIDLKLTTRLPSNPAAGAPPGPTSAFAPRSGLVAGLSVLGPAAEVAIPEVLPDPDAARQSALGSGEGHPALTRARRDSTELADEDYSASRGVAALADTGRQRTAAALPDVFELSDQVVQVTRCSLPAASANGYFARNVFGQTPASVALRCQ